MLGVGPILHSVNLPSLLSFRSSLTLGRVNNCEPSLAIDRDNILLK